MKRSSKIDSRYCLRAKDTTKERGHSFSDVVFLLPEVSHFIGFLTYLFPCLIVSRLIQRGGQQTASFKKCLCNDSTIITGLADRKIMADAKNRNDIE